MKEEKQELRYGKNVEWFLNELAAYEFSDLSDGEIEVYGEDTSGCEGSCTVDVTDLAADAAQLISELREELLQRDEQIAALTAENMALKECADLTPFRGSWGQEYKPTQTLSRDCGNRAVGTLKTSTANALRAEGVDMFGNSSYCPDEMQAAVNEFAKQLREGKM